MNIVVRTRESSERAENAGEVALIAPRESHPAAYTLEPEPIAIDPRFCELCGLTIDRHELVDDGDGPLFYCADISPDEMTLDELERRADLIRQEEVAAGVARLEANDDPSRRLSPRSEPEPHRPARSTVDAFFFVVCLNDAEYLKRWLELHPRDAEALCKLWEGKNAAAKA
jgi:hypothetical protein